MKLIACLAAIVVAACATGNIAAAQTADPTTFGTGQSIRWAVPNPYNADLYGCHDLGNTQELEQLRANASSSLDIRARDQYDTMIVTQYVAAHPVGASLSNACMRLPAGEWYKILKTFDWPGGGPRLHCLQPVDHVDVAAEPNRDCLWANLDRKPGVARQAGPAPAQRGTIHEAPADLPN